MGALAAACSGGSDVAHHAKASSSTTPPFATIPSPSAADSGGGIDRGRGADSPGGIDRGTSEPPAVVVLCNGDSTCAGGKCLGLIPGVKTCMRTCDTDRMCAEHEVCIALAGFPLCVRRCAVDSDCLAIASSSLEYVCSMWGDPAGDGICAIKSSGG